jgi:hypothetical protein
MLSATPSRASSIRSWVRAILASQYSPGFPNVSSPDVWWGREGGQWTGAFAVLVCATEAALDFVDVADQVLTGHLQHPGAAAAELHRP